jgi:hypothetical protein
MHRLQDGPSGAHKTEQNRMKDELAEYKREAEQVSCDVSVVQVVTVARIWLLKLGHYDFAGGRGSGIG